jgi:hypothetical protein
MPPKVGTGGYCSERDTLPDVEVALPFSQWQNRVILPNANSSSACLYIEAVTSPGRIGFLPTQRSRGHPARGQRESVLFSRSIPVILQFSRT